MTDAPPCRIALPRLSPDLVRVQNDLGRNVTPYPLAVGRARMLVALAGAGEEARTDPWLKLTLDGAEAAIQIPRPMMARIVGLPVENGLASDVALLLEDALTDWLDAAEVAGVPTLRFATITQMRPDHPVERALCVRGQTESGTFMQARLPVLLSAQAAERLAGLLRARVEPRTLPPGLPIPAEIRLAGPDLTPSALARLRPGDGIRLPVSPGDTTPAPFTLVIGTQAAAVTPVTGGYRLATALRPLPQGGLPMTQHADTASPAPDAPAAPDLTALPLRISFRIGEAALSLGEIATLGAGALIPVPGGPDATLDILANGRRIGRGELVAVGETRAVRVLSLD